MNKFLFFISFLLLLYSCNSQKPQLKFLSYAYDFGQVKRDSIYLGRSIIKNIGGDTLKISQISVDCSCTKVRISKRNILQNDTAIIEFRYRTSGKKGKQENFITLVANTDSIVHLLQINAFVK